MTDEPVNNSPPESALDSAGDRCVPCRRFRLNPRLLGKGWKRRYRWLFRVVLGGPLLLIVLLGLKSPLRGQPFYFGERVASVEHPRTR